jgi:hypothetical protein
LKIGRRLKTCPTVHALPFKSYNDRMRVTRRKLAQILTAAAAATATVEALPQTPAPAADEELRSARADLRANALRIAQVKLPMSAEPAFRFKA